MSKKMVIGGLAVLALTIGASAKVAKIKLPKVKKTAVAAQTVVPTVPSVPLLSIPATWLAPPAEVAPPAAAPVAAPLAEAALRKLPPLDLSDMWLWNWNGKWIGSEWTNQLSPLPWKFEHIQQPAGTDTLFTMNAAGSAQLQAGVAEANSDGLWEADVTLPQLKEGLVVAPLWLYDPNSRDEIDFELAGKRGLDVSLHAYVNGAHQQNTVRLFAGTDLSGRRMRFGIKLDQKSGFIEMYVDGKKVHRWDRATTGFFVSHPVKPWFELWAADPNNSGFVQWVGKWPGLAQGETLTMRVHGYGFTNAAGQVVR